MLDRFTFSASHTFQKTKESLFDHFACAGVGRVCDEADRERALRCRRRGTEDQPAAAAPQPAARAIHPPPPAARGGLPVPGVRARLRRDQGLDQREAQNRIGRKLSGTVLNRFL